MKYEGHVFYGARYITFHQMARNVLLLWSSTFYYTAHKIFQLIPVRRHNNSVREHINIKFHQQIL